MSRLDQLYFGRDEAESDIAQGGLLRAGFLPTAAYKAALSGKKRLIIGRKGSGKSAICMTLATLPDEDHVACLVTPDPVSQDEVRRFQLEGVTEEISKSLFWRYVLGLQVAKHIVSHARVAHRKKPESVKTLAKFLKTVGETNDPTQHEQFWRSVQRLKSLQLGAFGASLKVDIEGKEPSEGVRTNSQLNAIEACLKAAVADLACPPEHPQLLLLIDQLENVWSNDPASEAIVTGLLLAAKYVTAHPSRVKCVVFIRTDIYDALPFAEKDKFRGDEMRIEWTPARLKDLALARAQASIGAELSASDLWTSVFPGRIAGATSGDYLVARTLRRPRDLIQFANLCRDTAEKNGHDSIASSDVEEAEVQFSQWKLQDLAGEYGINYPYLADLFVLFQSSGYIVSRNTLTSRIEARRATLAGRFPDHVAQLFPNEIIDTLYGIGFLGVERDKKTVYCYDDPALIEPNECRFYVHPCFRQALRSTTATDLHPYPRPEIFGHTSGRLGRIGLVPAQGKYTQLQGEVSRAADRIMNQLADPGLPPEAFAELRAVVETVLDENMSLVRSGNVDDDAPDMLRHVRWVCGLLLDAASQLQGGGIGDDPGVRLVARIMEDEARRLASQADIRV